MKIKLVCLSALLSIAAALAQPVPSYRLMSNTNLPPLPYDPRPWLETITNADGSIIWVDNATQEGQVLDLVATAANSPARGGIQPLDSSGPPSPGPGDTNAPAAPWQPVFYFQGLAAPGIGEADKSHPLIWCAYRIWNSMPRAGWDWQQGTVLDDGDIIWCVWPNETVRYATNWPYGVFTVAVTNGSGVWVTNSKTLYMHAGVNSKRDVLLFHPSLGFTNLEVWNGVVSNWPSSSLNNQGKVEFYDNVFFNTNWPIYYPYPTNFPPPLINTNWNPTYYSNWPVVFTNGTPGYTNPNPYAPYPSQGPCNDYGCTVYLPNPVAPYDPYAPPQCIYPTPEPPNYNPFHLPPLPQIQFGTNSGGATTAAQRMGSVCGLPGTNYEVLIAQGSPLATNWFTAGRFGILSNGVAGPLSLDTNSIASHWNTNGPEVLYLIIHSPTLNVTGKGPGPRYSH